METFKYTAVSKSGEKVSGVVEAFNEMDASSRIKQNHKIILKLEQINQSKESILNKEIGGNRLNAKAFTIMCSQFAIILSSGVSIGRTVTLIAQKTTDKSLKKVLTSVAKDVDEGRSISQSFAARGEKLFPATFIETIYAGEQSGNLDKAFDSLYRHFDKQMKMKAKVRSALSYPTFVLLVAIGVVVVLMVKVVPTFLQIFDAYDAELPFMTRLLIAISNFFSKYWIYLFVCIALIFLGYKFYTRSENGRLNMGKLQLKIPVLGNIATLNGASEFSNNMVMLLNAGLPLNQAIAITARTMENYYVGHEVGKLAGMIEEGHALGDSMKETDCLPDILIDMVAVGEETGELESTLKTIAKYYDAELDMAIDKALKKLEPSILIFMALVAGFIVVAIYMSMFEMYSIM